MTKTQFRKLKVGDRVHLPHGRHRLSTTSTEVLEIDRFFGNLKVLLGNGWMSYRYIQKGERAHQNKGREVGAIVGTIKTNPKLTYTAYTTVGNFK